MLNSEWEKNVETAVPTFMQYGAMGILAMGFLVLLILFVRADKRAGQYAAALKEASFDRSQLIGVVVDNTKANAALASQIGDLAAAQRETGGVIREFNNLLSSGHCPFHREPPA